MTGWQEFIQGIKDELPLQLGVIPFGMVFGLLGIEAGLSVWQTFFLSIILFGGASQIVFVQMIAAGTPPAVIWGSVSAINLRHLLYSMSMARYLRELPFGWRVILAYLLTDEAYAISIRRFQDKPHHDKMHYHLLGSGLTLWTCWILSTAGGILAGASIPAHLELGFAIPLTFIALVLPALKHKAEILAALAAGITAILCQPLPYNLWLITAALVGIATGMASRRIWPEHSS
ncbi:MAG: AzlC family ABC transporter permease [Candidatus Puniceispirillaceae bacterium]